MGWIREPEKTYPGSRGQKSTGSQIWDPGSGSAALLSLMERIFFTVSQPRSVYNGYLKKVSRIDIFFSTKNMSLNCPPLKMIFSPFLWFANIYSSSSFFVFLPLLYIFYGNLIFSLISPFSCFFFHIFLLVSVPFSIYFPSIEIRWYSPRVGGIFPKRCIFC